MKILNFIYKKSILIILNCNKDTFNIMQVVIICGGKGIIEKKNYKSTPKALIEFKQLPNLQYQIDS